MTDSPEEGEGAGRRVYDVPDLRPGGNYTIEVLDLEHNPMPGLEFGYVVDEGERRTGTTDDNGILGVVTNGPPARIDLYLEGEEEDRGAGPETEQEVVGQQDSVEPDLQSGDAFMIEVLDREHNSVPGAEFRYAVDEGDERTGTTDNNGILWVATDGSPTRIDLHLGDGEMD